jgi:hypothetical protein
MVRGSSVVTVTEYGLDGWCKILPLLHVVQTGSRAHPSSYPMGNVGFFLLGKRSRSVKLTTHLHLVSGSRMVELYLRSCIRIHGVVRN